ncbi:MAG: helix-turn-helix domain-containing protein [Lachnospiraceae bacterium]
MSYVTGRVIKELREKRGITQKELSEILCISDKTVSKWETERGLPDISMLSELAFALQVSVPELLAGEQITNQNQSANMKKVSFYVCPVCGNIIWAVGYGMYSCCGIQLPALETEENDKAHEIQVQLIENEYYVTVEHSMTREHYISFIAYVTSDAVQLVKMYPQQDAQARFLRKGHGSLYIYCNRHGLRKITI